jgi:hypothetical protein
MPLPLRAVPVAVALALLGCGDDVAVESSPSSGGGGPGGGGATSSSGTGSGGSSCADFAPEIPPAEPIRVDLTNASGAPLYLGQPDPGCFTAEPFRVEDAGQVLKSSLEPCELTCADLQTGSCACAADCASPQVVFLPSGATHSSEWAGVAFRDADMPPACLQDPTCVGGCWLPEVAGPPLTIVGSAWTALGACTDDGTCDCVPGASGWCIVDGATTVSGTEVTASAEWTGAATVAITLE